MCAGPARRDVQEALVGPMNEIKTITQYQALTVAKKPTSLLGLFIIETVGKVAYEIGIDNREGHAIVHTGTKDEVMTWLRDLK